jgi:hypothetical protein
MGRAYLVSGAKGFALLPTLEYQSPLLFTSRCPAPEFPPYSPRTVTLFSKTVPR